MGDYQFIHYEVEDPVAVVTLNRPEKLNAFTYAMLAEIRGAIEAAAADPAVVGIVVTGAGRGFTAGLDSMTLSENTERGGPDPERDAPTAELPGLFTYLLGIPKPVIAAVNGVAAGGGLMLALLSDVRIASTQASFTTVFLKRGLIAEHGASWILPRLVGPGRAMDLLLTSRRIDAAEAHRIGLVDFLAEPADLLDRARAYVREIAANASPGAIRDTKRLVYNHLGAGYPEALREADRAQWEAIARDDSREGARALLEKREPRFARLG